MYTHARRFPHFSGLDGARIRGITARAMIRRPALGRAMRLRNAAVLIGMLLATALLSRFSALEPGISLGLVGGAATAFVLCWNLVWLNTVFYRATREEVEQIQP